MKLDAQSDLHCDPNYEQEPELALLALLSMLSRYPFSPSACMADSIGKHLVYVAGEARLSPLFREAAARLYGEWQSMTATPESPHRTH